MRDPNCKLCPLHKTAQHVCLLGQGPKPSEVMVIGEAPGEREDDSGKPFVGRSGKLLTETLESYGLAREDIYITNAVSCRPPDNRTPKKNEIKACRHWLFKQMARVKPKYVLLLGNVPLEAALDLKGIKSLRGKPIERDGTIYLPTFHPSYILRDPRFKEIFEADLRLFKDIVEEGGIPEEEGLNVVNVDTPKKFRQMINDLEGTISSDLETTCLYPWAPEAKVNSIGFGTKTAQYILLLNHPGTGWTNKDIEKAIGMSVKDMVEEIDDKIQDCKIVGQNWKFDSLWMKVHYDVEWYAHFDTMLAHFLLDENTPHGLKQLSQVFYGAIDYDIDTKSKIGGGGNRAQFIEYQAKDLYYTRKLRFTLGGMLKKDPDVNRVFREIMMPCSKIFTKMEYHGVYVDIKQMDIVEKKLREDLAQAEKELKKWGDINWNSPQQLAELLFDKLEIDVVEKTKGGARATNESVLLRIDHPIARTILRQRSASKQLSFFIDGWKPFIDKNGRIHPSFKLHGTVTGRLSCANPNLQQVPRDPVIRSLLTAPPGYTLLEVDLSQIELRIAAELSRDKNMLKAFREGIDVHWLTAIREIERGAGMADIVLATARKLSGNKQNYTDSIQTLLKYGPDACQEIDKSWKELRKKAKAINFGYLYGMWWKKFKIYARDNYGVEVTDHQAEQSRKAYFELYRDLKSWHDKQKEFVREHGYVPTLSGRKRRLPDATVREDSYERGAAERQAINSPVQSFANELNLMTLIQVFEEYDMDDVAPVGTVHDAILMEVRTGLVPQVTKRILKIMQRPDLLDTFDVTLQVPIEADASIGPWGNSVSLEKWLEKNPQ